MSYRTVSPTAGETVTTFPDVSDAEEAAAAEPGLL
jgi:hypothetical protein